MNRSWWTRDEMEFISRSFSTCWLFEPYLMMTMYATRWRLLNVFLFSFHIFLWNRNFISSNAAQRDTNRQRGTQCRKEDERQKWKKGFLCTHRNFFFFITSNGKNARKIEENENNLASFDFDFDSETESTAIERQVSCLNLFVRLLVSFINLISFRSHSHWHGLMFSFACVTKKKRTSFRTN